MALPSERSLKRYAHKRHVRQAVVEGVVAVLPVGAFAYAYSVLSFSAEGERFAPTHMGWAFPTLLIAYILFLIWAAYDIRSRIKDLKD